VEKPTPNEEQPGKLKNSCLRNSKKVKNTSPV
jgi:hypothetical protein